MFNKKKFVESAKKQNITVALVMVTFNRWKLTRQSLLSIFKNTYMPYTLTVVDNASCDGSQDKLSFLKRQGKIDKLILLPKNMGIGKGKNFGLKANAGKANWYVCIDNDIVMSPYWLAYLCYAASLPGLGIIGCNVQGFGVKDGLKWYKITHWKTMNGVILDNCPNPGGIYVMSASTFKKIGYFRQWSLYGLEDSNLHSRQKYHKLRSAYVRNVKCRELPDENFQMGKDNYRNFKTKTHQAIVERIEKLRRNGVKIMRKHYETDISLQQIEKYMYSPLTFWAVAQHHAVAILPIYEKMMEEGKDVMQLFSQPFKKIDSESIVSSTGFDVPSAKRKNTIYHFHSLSPYHINPNEPDYKCIPFFKAAMFPGEWWINKWKKMPKRWAVVGWPKSDLILQEKNSPPQKTVLYASSMFDFYRMKTLRLLFNLSRKLRFNLIVKPHHGTAMWFPKDYKTIINEVKNRKNVSFVESTADVASLFGDASLLVSESSGALWEFMATGKPSIQMTQAKRWGRLFPGGVLKADFKSLEGALKRCFDNPAVCKDMGWCERVMGKVDGKATDRAIKFIEDVFNE